MIKVGYQHRQVLVPFYELFTAPAAHILVSLSSPQKHSRVVYTNDVGKARFVNLTE